jgi:hypothetical protein
VRTDARGAYRSLSALGQSDAMYFVAAVYRGIAYFSHADARRQSCAATKPRSSCSTRPRPPVRFTVQGITT